MNLRMPAPSREVRVQLPLVLERKLRLLAAKERTNLNALIVNAVSADLRNGKRPTSARKKS